MCSDNKGADPLLCSYCTDDVLLCFFAFAKIANVPFSVDTAQIQCEDIFRYENYGNSQCHDLI